jgi:hypothetical protein
MGTLLVIGAAIGLWLVVFVVVIAACRAAQLGDEALTSSVAPASRSAPSA